VPELERRPCARLVHLAGLDPASGRGLLRSLGVGGDDAHLDEAVRQCGGHAKAVELLGTFLRRFRAGRGDRLAELPPLSPADGASDEEARVARVLAAFQAELPRDTQDLLALATAFRDPPTEARLHEYLLSPPVAQLLHHTWGRTYPPFADRPADWLPAQLQELIDLRLLERVSGMPPSQVIDAHPLVRRAFEHVLGSGGRRQSATARAGFLRGRPDRRRPAELAEAREEIELFHAFCDAGLWNEADATLVALDNPKHRFLAPALERDLLLRFFPQGDWRQPPLWPGFGRFRSLAIAFELLGQFDDALAAYREADAALRGDALLALGRLAPLLDRPQVSPPWQTLWQAYRAHALSLADRLAEAVALARSLVPVDVYEWVHVFECLLRCGRLDALDLKSVLYRPPHAAEHRWADLARRRMRADYRRRTEPTAADLGDEYAELVDAYDQGGLPYERALTRLGFARWLVDQGRPDEAAAVNAVTLDLTGRYGLRVLRADALALAGDADAARAVRAEVGYLGPDRP
jgi:tetratricopeptide (TPR) repeat protein